MSLTHNPKMSYRPPLFKTRTGCNQELNKSECWSLRKNWPPTQPTTLDSLLTITQDFCSMKPLVCKPSGIQVFQHKLPGPCVVLYNKHQFLSLHPCQSNWLYLQRWVDGTPLGYKNVNSDEKNDQFIYLSTHSFLKARHQEALGLRDE